MSNQVVISSEKNVNQRSSFPRLACSFQSSGYSDKETFLDRPLLKGDSYGIPFQILNVEPRGISPLAKVLNREYKRILDNLSYFLPMRGLRNWISPLDLQTNKINEEGSNIATFLAYLQSEREDSFDQIEEWICKFDSSIQSIRAPLNKRNRGTASLEIKEKEKYKHILTLGSGLISVIPLIVEIVISKPGHLIMIEEPEIHLHHGAIEILIELFIEAIKQGKQIIITTHSIDLLNAVYEVFTKNPELEEQIVRFDMTREKETRQTKATRIEPSEEYKVWSQGFKSILKTRPS